MAGTKIATMIMYPTKSLINKINTIMILEPTLTKENFFDEMKEKFPNAMKHFCNWVDEYKKAVNWDKLFSSNENTDQLNSSKYKFHEIPYAMQYGIWIEYCRQSLSDFFEQPEHISDSVDLREDIEMVFKETEVLIVFDK